MNEAAAIFLRMMRERFLLGCVVGVAFEAGWQVLGRLGVVRQLPNGFMLVTMWCIYSSNAYGSRYERVTRLLPASVASVFFAVFFALATWLMLLGNRIDRPAYVPAMFALSLVIGVASTAAQWWQGRSR